MPVSHALRALVLVAAIVATGCQAYPTAPGTPAHAGDVAAAGPAIVVTPTLASAYHALTALAPYDENDVKRLEVRLYEVADLEAAIASDATPLKQAVLTEAMFATAVTFSHLQPGKSYRVKVVAFDQPEGGLPISQDDPTMEAAVTLPELPTAGEAWDAGTRAVTYRVKLLSRPFDAAGIAPGIVVRAGGIAHDDATP